MAQPEATGIRALPDLRHGTSARPRSSVVQAGLRAGCHPPCQGGTARAPDRDEEQTVMIV
jgi:hypothetical protein